MAERQNLNDQPWNTLYARLDEIIYDAAAIQDDDTREAIRELAFIIQEMLEEKAEVSDG